MAFDTQRESTGSASGTSFRSRLRGPLGRSQGRAGSILAMLALLAAVGPCAALQLPPASEDPDLRHAWQDYQDRHFPTAARYYARAARRGQPIGEYNFGMMLINGEGVRRDEARGRTWLFKAARAGLAQAEYTVGLLYENGQGVAKSQSDAVYWYQLASEQGHSEAQLTLATQYFLGRGVAQDYALAAKWYESAAESGVEPAQYIIASCYEHGDGVPADLERAIYWYTQAGLQGDSAAQYKARVLKEAQRQGKPS